MINNSNINSQEETLRTLVERKLKKIVLRIYKI
jgi:hypothetical protein